MTDDYLRMLHELGVTEEDIQKATYEPPWYPDDNFNFWVAESDIDGFGFFTRFMRIGQRVLAGIDGKKMTPGRFTNHSDTPNADYETYGGFTYIKALRDIENEEITVDYRNSPGAQALKDEC